MPKKLHLPLSACLLLTGQPLLAQMTLDGTLGKNNVLSGPNYQIGANLGLQQSGNLFHSFRDFNLKNNETATFTGPANVANIISRVTGGQPSSIDGTIRSTIPNANMYFLNPYGIMFGPHAKLDVQGSFHASTADVLRFDGQTTEVHAHPSDNPMLVIAPATSFGFLTNAPAPIITQNSILSVPEGKTLSLIGGELRLTGTSPPKLDEQQRWTDWKSVLSASAGRINLASLASSGEVFLRDTGLEFSPSTQTGPLTAENTLIISNSENGGNGGDIFIRAGQLKLSRTDIETSNWTTNSNKTGRIDIDGDTLELDGSELSTTSYGSGGAGDITLKIAGNLTLLGARSPNGSSVIASHAQQGQRAGQLNLQAKQVQVRDGSQIFTDTEGPGPGGAITIQTETLEVTGTAGLGQASRISTETRSPNINAGTGGEIKLNAETITVANHGQVETRSGGSGASGNLDLTAKTVAVTDQALVQSHATGAGASGTVTVNTDQLTVSGQIASRTHSGSGGHLNVTAKTVAITDPGVVHSGTTGAGAGGTVTINTDELTVSGRIESDSQDSGAGGNLDLTAKTVAVTDPGLIHSGTTGAGAGGKVTLNTADELTVSGRIESRSQHFGAGGNLDLTAKTVTVTNPGVIHSSTTGAGTGGTVTVNTDQLTMTGRIESQSQESGSGGHLNVTTQTVAITDPGVIHSSTTGTGAGGTVTVNTNQMTVSGRIESHTQNSGTGGNLKLTSPNVAITDSGVIHSSTSGTGAGGTVTVETNQLTMTGRIESQTQHIGSGGPVNLTTKTLAITDPGLVHSSTSGTGAGGTVTVNADRLTVSGRIETHAEQTGAGGNLELTSPTLTVSNQGLIQTMTTGAGDGGSVKMNTEELTLSGQIESDTQHSGAGGNVALTAKTVTMTHPATIHSRTTGPGAGGAVTVHTDQMMMTEAHIGSVTSATGIGGAIQMKASSLTLLQGGTIEAHSKNRGLGGAISLQIADSLKLSGASSKRYPSRIATGSWFQDETASDAGAGGDIEITSTRLSLLDRGQITAFTHGTGKGGEMTFNIKGKLAIHGTWQLDNPQTALSDEYPRTSGIFTRSFYNHEDAGDAGDLTISATDLELLRGGELATVARYAGGGNLLINVTDKLLLQDSLLVAYFKQHRKNSGNITLNRSNSLILNNSKIFSEVEFGKAGDAHIASDKIAVSSNSSLSATLRLQIDGQLFLGSPEESLCPDALLGSQKFLDASGLMQTPCGLRDNTSSFIITEREGVSEPQDDLLPSGLPRLGNK